MNEIEKMYEKLNIKKEYECNAPACYRDLNACPLWCKNCEHLISFYPPFTAEKQIRLVEILSKRTLKVFTNEQPFCVKVSVKDQKNDYFIGCEELNFGSALANLVSHLWQDLTEEEKQQVKEILK